MELKAGMYIAQSTEVNILIMLDGKAPFIEVIAAVDLNAFKAGRVVALKKESVQIMDIMKYPEKYQFALPSLTEAVNKLVGLNSFGYIKKDLSMELEQKWYERFKELMSLYSNDLKKVRPAILIEMFREDGIEIANGNYQLNMFQKALTNEIY